MDTYTIYHYVRGLMYAKEQLEKVEQVSAVKKTIKKLDEQIEFYKSML